MFYFFGTVKLVRNTIKSKFAYNGGGIGYNGEVSWSFGNEFARNVAIFGVDNSSSCHTDTRKTQGINDSMAQQKKKFNINFCKTNTKLCFSLHCPGDESYLYVNKT